MRVLVFGDSITQGYWDTEGGWVSRLRKVYDQQELNGRNPDSPSIYNLGISGDCSHDILKRFDSESSARDHAGDERLDLAIVFAVGVNDSSVIEATEVSSPAFYHKNLKELLDLSKEYTNKVLFVGLTPCVENRTTPVSWGNFSYTNERIGNFNKALEDFCTQNRAAFARVLEDFQQQQKKSELLPDGLHPNNKGHELLANLIRPQLEKVLAE